MFNFSYFQKKHKFANIELDAMLSQNIEMTNIVSEHTLETGELLNDAIHNQPLRISFSAVISDMPQTAIEQVLNPSATVDSVLTSLFSLKRSKSMKAWKELFLVWKAKKLVTISSPLQSEVFEDMAILSISVNVESNDSLTFSVNLKQVVISENITRLNLSEEVGKQSIRP